MSTIGARNRIRRACALAALVSTLAWLAPAQASLIGDTVTARLFSPEGSVSDGAPIDLSDSVLVGAGPELAAGDGSNIGGFMLENEAIDLGASSITVRLQQGNSSPPSTGYSDGARYVFSDLDIAGETITAVSFVVDSFQGNPTITNVAALGASWITLLDARTVQMFIDDILFLNQGGGESNNVATVTINLQSVVVVPEPSAWLMLAAGFAGLLLIRRLRASRQSHGRSISR